MPHSRLSRFEPDSFSFPVFCWNQDPNAPTLFISYSQDKNGRHRRWVGMLARKFSNLGIKTEYDRNSEGYLELPQYMQEMIKKSQYIICVCSESYVKKISQKIDSGVYEEYKHILKRSKKQKQELSTFVIPILKNSSRKKGIEKVPAKFKKILYRSFENEDLASKSFAFIAGRILNLQTVVKRHLAKQIRFSSDAQDLSDDSYRRFYLYWAADPGSKEEKDYLSRIGDLFDTVETTSNNEVEKKFLESNQEEKALITVGKINRAHKGDLDILAMLNGGSQNE